MTYVFHLLQVDVIATQLTHSKTKNFRLFQTERVCRQQFKFDKNGRKLTKWVENTVGKGEIARYEQFLLFPQCFQKTCLPGASKGVIVWEWVNSFQSKAWFLHVCCTSLLKTLWENEKLLVMSIFSFSHTVFNPFGELSSFFIKFKVVVCKLFRFGKI